MDSTVQCADCETFLVDETPHTKERQPCPACGSNRRSISIHVVDELKIYEQYGVKQKRVGFKKPIHELIEGDDYTHSTGRYSKKTRVIDRLNDRYYERVFDPLTGEVLREIEEPLSEHFGRGSAKLQPHQFDNKQIAIAAYYIWEREGRPDGRDRVHWDMAIEDLRRVAGGAPPRYT